MIHIYYQFQDGPWGGGNQFLKGLRNSLRAKGVYSETLEGSDTILVNSHHFGSIQECEKLLIYLSDNPSVKVVHRMDGPVTLIRNKNEGTDNIIFRFNELFADATIFQSRWCLDKCRDLGWREKNVYTIIFNAPDPNIFFANLSADKSIEHKIKIIATSWSDSFGKGFDVYQWLDQYLDWNRYAMTFVGNSPVRFENIKMIPAQPSLGLAEILRNHDIYITASRNDPCSNSLIEALHCGLPALVYRDGGHPELVGNGGLIFDKVDDIPQKIEVLSKDIKKFSSSISLPDMDSVALAYLNFSQDIPLAKVDKSSVDLVGFMRDYKIYLETRRPSLPRRGVAKLKSLIMGLFR